MPSPEQVISHTKKWINDIVIGCNFCPFAAREVRRNAIDYQVETGKGVKEALNTLLVACMQLDNDITIQTTFIIFPGAFENFDEYLEMVKKAEKLLAKKGYEGIYQLASFHPLYCFADAPFDDPANYTNRSIYPMLHLLREAEIEEALEHYANPGQIPERNMLFAREKGLVYMKMLRDGCLV